MAQKIIAVTGDLHMGQSLSYGGLTVDGLPSKILEQQELLKDFVDDCITRKVDMVVFTGDYFPKYTKVDPSAMRMFSEQVLRLVAAGIEVRIIVGNHDKARHEKLDNTVDYFKTFEVPHVKVINKPSVEYFGGAILIMVPHLIPSEMFRWQKNEREQPTEIMDHVVTEQCEEAYKIITKENLSEKTPRILFGHFGVIEAGKGSESQMVASNNICIPATILDRPEINLCVLGHIHKFWTYKGKHTNIAMIGSLDRFDFGECNDKKVYGRIVIETNELQSEVHLKTVKSKARNFLHIKETINDLSELTCLSKYDVNGAVVKASFITGKDFAQKKELIEAAREWLEKSNAHHIVGVVVISETAFASRNANITESKSVEDNLKQILVDEKFQDVESLMALHNEIQKEYLAIKGLA